MAMQVIKPARFGDHGAMVKASALFLNLLNNERQIPPARIMLEVDWRALHRLPPVERIMELRACGYNNDEIADLLGYKDARSVRAQINRAKLREGVGG